MALALLNHRKVLLLSLLLLLSVSVCFSAWSEPEHESSQFSSRRILGAEKQEPLKKKTTKPTPVSSKNQTKTIKTKSDNISSKNQTRTVKSDNISSKNQTKLSSTDTGLNNSTALKTKKLNVTSASKLPISSNKKTVDLGKEASKKTTKGKGKGSGTKDPNKEEESKKKARKQRTPSWMVEEEEEEDDLVSELTDLANKFHQTLLPDLERISTTSKAYISKANKEMTKGFKPYVGKKYAGAAATIISCALILIPLVLVCLLCTRIKAYFSLQRIIMFIQVYLSIYFTILCVTSLLAGFEPLKFLYYTSHSTYVCLQVLQTLAYIFYLLLLLMYLVLLFSTQSGLPSKFLGLAQIFVAFNVGLHYYVTVFHRLLLHQPPKTNSKIHGIYASSFLLISALALAHSTKKTYAAKKI
ncbi:hypothetical protein VNO78_10725 [Psophocarpus tetragonolobus]|uniref:Uncharacterized protein n=1 Tax=Psophocarpus tetragonolobus TaxID=3891 RepID=A0AAN9SML7_PSOTE